MMNAPLERLERVLGAYPSALVALSGGVDSSVVATLAHRAKGSRAVAVTLKSPSLPSRDLRMAREVAKVIGIRHLEIEIDQLTDKRYLANPVNRCYFCRRMEGERLSRLAKEMGLNVVADGVHLDDLLTDRPGLKAMEEWGMRHPLVEAELGKEEVRVIAKELMLPNHKTPSNSCLSSRITHGEPISLETLRRVDAAEEYLSELGFSQIRVRAKGKEASIEVMAEAISRLEEGTIRTRVEARLLSLGFRSVTVDALGYRSEEKVP